MIPTAGPDYWLQLPANGNGWDERVGPCCLEPDHEELCTDGHGTYWVNDHE